MVSDSQTASTIFSYLPQCLWHWLRVWTLIDLKKAWPCSNGSSLLPNGIFYLKFADISPAHSAWVRFFLRLDPSLTPHGTCLCLLHTSPTPDLSSPHFPQSQKWRLSVSLLIIRELISLIFVCTKPQYFLRKLAGPLAAVLSSKFPKPFLGSRYLSHHSSITAWVFFIKGSFCYQCAAYCLTLLTHHLHFGFRDQQPLAFF